MGLRLLCVGAHPDDECFAFGGALALAAAHGVETSVLCLTDGQAAMHRGSATSGQELGKMRSEEFAASCDVLGVAQHEMLAYQDARLEFEPLAKIAGDILERIRSFRPHVVVTFGLDGGANTHPDHTAVSAATSAAFHWAGNPKRLLDRGPLWQPQRLFHQTTNFFLPDRHKPLPAPWTLALDIGSVFEKKMEAFRKHTSQAPLEQQVRGLFQLHGQKEYYTLAASLVPQPSVQSTDMFEAIADET